jgi:hypothetical protein
MEKKTAEKKGRISKDKINSSESINKQTTDKKKEPSHDYYFSNESMIKFPTEHKEKFSNEINKANDQIQHIIINPYLPDKSIYFHSGGNGIIQDLKSSEENSITLSCSSTFDRDVDTQVSNILNYENDYYYWLSRNESS